MTNSIDNTDKKHILYLDGLRAIAAIYVVIHHSAIQYADITTTPGIRGAILFLLFRGHYAVDLFIVLSGYCLMLPVIKRDYFLANGAIFFFKRRAKRILPTYYLALLLSLILVWALVGQPSGTHWDVSIPISLKDILLHFTLTHDLFNATAYKINHAFWSISVESRIYLLFPILLIFWRRFGRVQTLVITCFIALCIYLLSSTAVAGRLDISVGLAGLNPYLILFTLGMFAADISISYKNNIATTLRKNIPWGIVVIISGVIMLLCDRLNAKNMLSPHILDVVVGIFSSALLIACAKPFSEGGRCQWIVNLLSWQPLAFIGTFAYSIYLIHAPLIQVFTQYGLVYLPLSHYNQTIVLILIGTPLIIGISYLFFLGCELPFLTPKATVAQIEKETIANPAP